MTADAQTIRTWKHHFQDEADAAYLYGVLAAAELDAGRRDLYGRLAAVELDAGRRDLYGRLAAVEERHTDLWYKILAKRARSLRA